MRYIFTIIGSVILAVSLVALGFSIKQVDQQRTTLTTNLEQRAVLLSDGLEDSIAPIYANSSQSSFTTSLQKIIDKSISREHLDGIALYDNKGVLLVTSSGLSEDISGNTEIVSDAMDSNTPNGNFSNPNGTTEYIHVDPLHSDDGSVIGAVMVIQSAGYVNTNLNQIWKGDLWRLLIQIILFSITIFIVLRFFVF